MEFTDMNLLIYQLALKSTTNSVGRDGNEMGGFRQNTAPKPTTSKGPVNEQFLSKISHMLKEDIIKAKTELKQKSQEFIKTQAEKNEVVRATPLSFDIPNHYDSSALSTVNEKTRRKTLLVGEIQKSFEIPEEYASFLFEIDKLPVLPHLQEKMKTGIEHKVRFKILERLTGWNFHCRQRDDGKIDMYFHHVRSNELLRSNIEVINFILYEICPRHLKKRYTVSNKNVSGSNKEEEVPQRSSIPLRSRSSRGLNIERKGKGVKNYSKRTSENFVGVNSSQMNDGEASASSNKTKIEKEKGVKKNSKRTSKKFVNAKSSQSFKTTSDKEMNDGEASASSNKTMIENYFLLEYKDGKRKRTEDSPPTSLERPEKCVPSSPPDLGTFPLVDVASNANVEVQEKMVVVSEPDQAIPEPVDPTVDPTDGQSSLEATMNPTEGQSGLEATMNPTEGQSGLEATMNPTEGQSSLERATTSLCHPNDDIFHQFDLKPNYEDFEYRYLGEDEFNKYVTNWL